MIADFDLVPIFHLIGVFVYVYPIELGRPGADGRDEPFALPAPVVLGVWEIIAGKRMAGGFFEFEVVFQRDVEVLSCLDVELKRGGERLWSPSFDACNVGKRMRTLWFFSTTIPPLICALCDELFTQVATRFVFCPRCFSFAFLFCPERTASVVPMMAGHAAIAVKSPKTMMAPFHRASQLSIMRINKTQYMNQA